MEAHFLVLYLADYPNRLLYYLPFRRFGDMSNGRWFKFSYLLEVGWFVDIIVVFVMNYFVKSLDDIVCCVRGTPMVVTGDLVDQDQDQPQSQSHHQPGLDTTDLHLLLFCSNSCSSWHEAVTQLVLGPQPSHTATTEQERDITTYNHSTIRGQLGPTTL